MGSNDLVNYEEASRITGIRKETLYSMVHHKRLPHYKYGRRHIRFSRAELEQWVRDKHVPERPDSGN